MKKFDSIFLAGWVILSPILLHILPSNFFISSIIYLLIPSIFFSIKTPEIMPKAFIVSFFTIPFVIICDYIAFLNRAWDVPTIFHFRFLKFIPVEDFFFTFLAVYVVVVAFNYFFRLKNYTQINKSRLKKSSVAILIVTIIFFYLYRYQPSIFFIPYFYFWLDIFAFIIPTLVLIKFFPAYRKPLVYVIMYLFILMLPYELTADSLGFWTFPSHQYIGMIHLFNQSFPIEEFFAWMIFFAPATLAFTEFIGGTE